MSTVAEWVEWEWPEYDWVDSEWLEADVQPLAPALYQASETPPRYHWHLGPVTVEQAEAFAAMYEGLHVNGTVYPIWVHKKPGELGDVQVCEWEGEVQRESLASAPGQHVMESTFSERVRTRDTEDG